MKKIVCEMCGSNDLIKKDGVFECQNCGTKYSVEEAKKLMIDGVVNVEGTVKIDDTNKIDNLIINAKQLYEDGKTDEAYELFGDALNIDPNNYIAIIYRGLCSAWKTSIAECKTIDIIKALNRGLEIIKEEYGENNVFPKMCMEILPEIEKICMGSINMYQKYIRGRFDESNQYIEELRTQISIYANNNLIIQRANADNEALNKDVKDAMGKMQEVLITSSIVIMKMKNVEDEEVYTEEDYKAMYDFLLNVIVKLRKIDSESFNEDDNKDYRVAYNLVVNLLVIIDNIKDKKREKYWEEHKEEKEQLEKEMEQLEEKLEKQEEKLDDAEKEKKEISEKLCGSVPAEKELNSLKKKLKILEDEKDSLGLFKIKERTKIQEKIDFVEDEIRDASLKVQEEKDELDNQLLPELEKINKKIEKINSEINNIKNDIENVKKKLKFDID